MKDLRKLDKRTSFQAEWFKDQYRKIRMVIPKEKLSNDELKKYLLDKYSKRRIVDGYIYNNTDKATHPMNQEEFINNVLQTDNIVSGYGVLFKNQVGTLNMGAEALKFFLDTRKVYKNKKFEAQEAGNTEEELYYNLLQLTYKVLANSYYGITSLRSSHFFNSYIQNSTTMTGQNIIQTSVMAFEAFLENNMKFSDENDILNFINNIKTEEYKLNIFDYVEEKSADEVYKRLIENMYEPMDSDIIKKAVLSLPSDIRTRVYFKSNLHETIKQPYFKDIFSKIIKGDYKLVEGKASSRFDLSDDMHSNIKLLNELLLEIVLYDYLYEDRLKRINKDKKKAILVVDTDSNFLHIDPLWKLISSEHDLDPKDSVQKNMVLNIFIEMLEEVVKKTYWTMTSNMGLPDDFKEIIRMKSEFLYSRLIVTNKKKNYAGMLEMQEGAIFKEPRLDIKGLPIKKSNVPKKLKPRFFEILQKSMLQSEKISLKGILKEYKETADIVSESLSSGKLEFSLPKSVDAIENYTTPHTQLHVRGALAWNALYPDKALELPEKVNVVKLMCKSPDTPEFMKLKETHNKEYNIILTNVFEKKEIIDEDGNIAYENLPNQSDFAKYGFVAISLPKDETDIPSFLIPLIDVETIVANNMSAGASMLESIGIVSYKTTEGLNKRTNIIEI